MTQPTPYTPVTDFSNDEASAVGGRSTVRTANIDSELVAIASSLNAAITNLGIIQRDDGEIRDAKVKMHTLAQEVLSSFKSQFLFRGAWVTPMTYAINDMVDVTGTTYICVIPHTSGVFATDLAALKWMLWASSVTSLLTQAVARDGSNSPSANLPMASFKHTSVGSAAAEDQYMRLKESRDQSAIWLGTFGGTANAITASASPALVSYAAGQRFVGVVSVTNTASVTVDIQALGVKNLTKTGSIVLRGGDLVAGSVVSFTYDGARFQLDGRLARIRGASIVSAGTVDLSQASGEYAHLTGSSAITVVILGDGDEYELVVDNTPTFTHSASLIMPSGASVVGEAGDIVRFRGDTPSIARCVSYSRASGRPVVRPGIERISSGTVSNQPNVEFKDLSAEYESYLLRFRNLIAATDSVNLNIHVSTDNGVNYNANSGAYDFSALSANSASPQAQTSITTAFSSAIRTNINLIGNTSSRAISGNIEVIGPMDSSVRTTAFWSLSHAGITDLPTHQAGSGRRLNAEANNAFRITFSAGNISSMSWVLYGMRA